MQVNRRVSSSCATPAHPQQLLLQQLVLKRTVCTHYQSAPQGQGAAPSGQKGQLPAVNGGKQRPAIPAPQDVQASVMLTAKKDAAQELLQQAAANSSFLNSFLVKCRLAWNLFFPPAASSGSTRQLSPKDLGKQRLSMILVADRCGLSPNSLVEMKRNTLAALQDCMDLEDLQDAHLRFTMTRESGVTYSMAVPILRQEMDLATAAQDSQGATDSDLDALDPSEHLTATWEDDEDDEQQQALVQHLETGSLQVDSRADSATETCKPSALQCTSEVDMAERAAPALAAYHGSSEPHILSSEDTASLVDVPGTAAMSPEQLKEMLVEELVQDMQQLVGPLGPEADNPDAASTHIAAAHVEATGVDDSGRSAVGAAATTLEMSVLAEQLLEAAVAEVQHCGEFVGLECNQSTGDDDALLLSQGQTDSQAAAADAADQAADSESR